MSAVAFIGLGAMGSRMAARLIDAGHDLVVWNRTPAKAKPLVERGARAADSPAAAARQAEVVITMVTDPDALRAVTSGRAGVAGGVADTTTVIEMSTVGPAAVSRLASALPAGTNLLDAPVLGTLPEAESGKLQIFVGGTEPLVKQWTPLLSALGTPLHVGPLGSGAQAKLVANTTLVGIISLLGEAIALADGLGLSREAAFDVLAKTPLALAAERRRPAIETGDYSPRFPLSLARKDADLILQSVAGQGVDLRVVRAAQSWLARAEQDGLGDRDYSAVLTTILRGN